MSRLASYVAVMLTGAGSFATIAAAPPAGPALPPGTPTTTIQLLTRSAVAAEGLKKMCELRQKGDPLPPGCASVGTWSQRYIEALREETKERPSLIAALTAHREFMEKYVNWALQQHNKGKVTELENLDASFGFVTAHDALQAVIIGGQSQP